MSLYDENAEVLRQLESRGCELRSPRRVDFSHVFLDHPSADAFVLEAERQGFTTTTEEIAGEEFPWDVTASREMTPTSENITEAEERLGSLAQNHRGKSDGWGFFGI